MTDSSLAQMGKNVALVYEALLPEWEHLRRLELQAFTSARICNIPTSKRAINEFFRIRSAQREGFETAFKEVLRAYGMSDVEELFCTLAVNTWREIVGESDLDRQEFKNAKVVSLEEWTNRHKEK